MLLAAFALLHAPLYSFTLPSSNPRSKLNDAARAFALTPATTGVLVHATRRGPGRALATARAPPRPRLWWEPRTGRVDRARWATIRARSFPTLAPLSPGPRAEPGGAL